MLTFTSTVQPIVWEGRAMGEPLTIRWTKEDFPTPARMRKYYISAIKNLRYLWEMVIERIIK